MRRAVNPQAEPERRPPMTPNPQPLEGDITDCSRCGGMMMISHQMVSVCGQCLHLGNHRAYHRKRRSAAARKWTHRYPTKGGRR